MSDTTEMVRLIRHAASRLAEEDYPNDFGLTAAIAYAEAVLNLVAACMEPESEPTAKVLARVRELAEKEDLYVRVDELLEALDGAP